MHLYADCSGPSEGDELAPAPNLPDELRERICADAVAFAREVG